jgi:hypothetical protein
MNLGMELRLRVSVEDEYRCQVILSFKLVWLNKDKKLSFRKSSEMSMR